MKTKRKSQKIYEVILDYITLCIGGILLGISIEYILLPVKMTTGGYSGIATLMHYLLKIPTEVSIILLNVPTFIITWKVLGKKFGVRSFVGMLMCSAGAIIGRQFDVLTNNMMLAALYGGALAGIGVALAYKAGGSTGGTDIIAKLISVKAGYINVGEAFLIIDGIIIAIMAIVFKDLEIGLYSVIAAFVASKVIDVILIGADYAKALFVITSVPEEISRYMHIEIGRTTTKFKVIGTYTDKEKEMLMCVVSKKEIPKLKSTINEIDPEAFMIVTSVTEAIGRGF